MTAPKLNLNLTAPPLSLPSIAPTLPQRRCGKLEAWIESRILNPNSGFLEKGLCDGPTFTAGTACFYDCTYCYVEDQMRKAPGVQALLHQHGVGFQQIMIRRRNAVAKLQAELRTAKGMLKYKGGEYAQRRSEGKPFVCYGSPLVDIAATPELVEETIQIVQLLLNDTDWDLRLLSKSPLIQKVARSLSPTEKHRVIFGLSTGSLDDALARAVEPTCPSPARRTATLRWLQDQGYRTFAMLCPILPQPLPAFVAAVNRQVRPERCEHVWAEVVNLRGDSFTQSLAALTAAGLTQAAQDFEAVCGTGGTLSWEAYARETFQALAAAIPRHRTEPKLRFLQYVTPNSESWWQQQIGAGAIPLGGTAANQPKAVGSAATTKGPAAATRQRSAAAKKAWVTIRAKQAAGTAAGELFPSGS